MDIENEAKQVFLISTAEQQIADFQCEQRYKQEIAQCIVEEKQRFDEVFGSDIREYLEQKCDGKWDFNYAPGLDFCCNGTNVRLYFSKSDREWRWLSGRDIAKGVYARFCGDFRQLLLKRIGELLVKR